MIHDAHAFRGEYIDLCARIEGWATDILRSEQVQRTGKAKRLPQMLGKKLELIGSLAADNAVFARPARIRALLAEIHPLMQLRADLAHSTLTVSTRGTDEILIFELPIAQPAPHFTGRFWLAGDEMPALLGMLRKSHKELNDQRLKD